VNNIIRISLLSIVIIYLQACSSFISATNPDPLETKNDKRTTGSFIDDEIIETTALVNIDKAAPELAQSHIVVVSFNRVVLLTGQVNDQKNRQLAAETVANIHNVRRVHNELMIAGNSSMVARSNDSWITTKVKSKLLADSSIEANRIKVVTENGVVYILGIVTKEEGDRVAESARKTGGVQKVVRIFEYIPNKGEQ
jgi:osmotically-inducible protein OsmY